MGTTLKIAVRNLVQHQGKTFIVGGLISLGIFLTFIGNSLFESAAQGVKQGYTTSVTGDLMIKARSDRPFNLFGSEDFSLDAADAIPVLQNYEQILATLRSVPQVATFTSVISSYANLNFEAQGQALDLEDMDRGDPMFGIDPDTYFKTFPGVRVLEGRLLQAGERGIVMSRTRLDQIAADKKIVLKLGDEIHLNAFSETGLKVRVVPLVGIYQFQVPNKGFEGVSFVDLQTLRALGAMTIGTPDEVKLDASTQSILQTSSDDFFSDKVASVASGRRVDFGHILGDTANRDRLQTIDEGSWHDILIRLKPDSDIPGTVAALNTSFEKNHLPAVAVDWKGAAGFLAGMTDVAQVLFNLVILLLTVVAVIIIVNTLVISVMERTPEIGTMRALGAQKSFVRRLFITETMVLAAFFGVLGLGLGALGVMAIDQLKIPIENDALQLFFGATDLGAHLSLGQVTLALFDTVVIGVVSWIYPVSVALKVTPLKAITTE